MGDRRQSRELALQFLYGYCMNRSVPALEEAITDFWNANRAPEEVRQFSSVLIKGTIDNLERIDNIIRENATNWKIDRIALVDKNILRVAIYELLYRDDIPSAVTINEAVEIAKKFSTPRSGKFVNGILDKVKEKVSLNKKDVEK